MGGNDIDVGLVIAVFVIAAIFLLSKVFCKNSD